MHNKFTFSIYIFAFILLLATNTATARTEISKKTICYVVQNDKISYRGQCIVTQSGGAGVSVLMYTIKGEEFTIIEDNDGETLNEKEFTGYMRDTLFRKTSIEGK